MIKTARAIIHCYRLGAKVGKRVTKRNISTTSAFFAEHPEEDMDKLKSNPYYAKYAEKLQKAQEEDPSKFDAHIEAMERERREKLEDARKQAQEALENAKKAAAQRKAESLNAVMKLELLEDKTPEEIEELWKKFHEDKDFIFAVLTGEEWKEMSKKVAQFPTFIYPLPRQMGYEFFLQQVDGNDCHFTPLIAYQTQKENAPPCLTVTYYPDLLNEKDIVLMRGEPDMKTLSIYEAQLLALQFKQYYGHQSGLKFNHVRTFNNSPDSFKHMDLIKEFEFYKKDLRDIKSGDI